MSVSCLYFLAFPSAPPDATACSTPDRTLLCVGGMMSSYSGNDREVDKNVFLKLEEHSLLIEHPARARTCLG